MFDMFVFAETKNLRKFEELKIFDIVIFYFLFKNIFSILTVINKFLKKALG